MFNNAFRQVATYWAPLGGDNGFGKINLAAPVSVKCRWEDKQDQTIDAKGKEIISKAYVYFPDTQQVGIGGYLLLGISTNLDPRQVTSAWEIKNTNRVPNIRNLQALITAIL